MMKKIIFIFLLSLASVGSASAACFSDFDCGMGNKCVKASGDINLTGVCVVPSDRFGNRRIDTTTPRSQPRNVSGCSFDLDCGLGFSCMKRSGQLKGICVK